MPAAHPLARRAGRLLVALVAAAAVLAGALTAPSAGDLQSRISSAQSAASALSAQIAADSQQIAATTAGLRQARARLDVLQQELSVRVARLRVVQDDLLAARARLLALENRMRLATRALAANLVADYETGRPDLMSVILQARGFDALLDQLGYMTSVAHHNAGVLGQTRTARRAVAAEARELAALESRDRTLAQSVLAQRNQVAAFQSALQSRWIDEVSARGRAGSRYAAVSAELSKLHRELAIQEARAAAAAARAAVSGNAGVGGIAVDTGGMVQPPPNAPEAVKQVIAAGNAIATLPYIYGGGHASFQADGYDCSGSVSYALAAAGLVSSPMVSGQFEDWGDPGPGRWITIYANAEHVWMEVAGWRFDTVALAEDGTRWAQGGGEFSGFVVRHPPGL